MVWPPRYATAAANRPKYEVQADLRADVYFSATPDNNSAAATGLIDPFDDDALRMTWGTAAFYEWANDAVDPLTLFTDTAVRSVIRPPELQGGNITLRVVDVFWPDAAQYPEHLGARLYSRPAGAASWRTQTTWLPYTEELDRFSPSNLDVPLSFKYQFTANPADEYQFRGLYRFQDSEVFGEIRRGDEIPETQYVLFADAVHSTGTVGLFSSSRQAVISQYIRDIVLEPEERPPIPSAGFLKPYQYPVGSGPVSLFATTVEMQPEERLSQGPPTFITQTRATIVFFIT